LTGAFSTGSTGTGAAFGAGLGAEPPKKPPNAGAGFLATGVGAGSTFSTFLTAGGGDENKENVPLPFGAGALTGAGGALGAGFGAAPPNNESVGDGLRTGAGLGATGLTSTFFSTAGLLAKRLNGCDGLGLGASATGSGLGGAAGVGALLEVPKKEFNASVMALGAISMSAFFGGVETTFGGSGVTLAFGFSGAGCKNEKRFDASAFFSAFTGAGGVGFTGAAGLVGAETRG
jgi:hypothetical protein